MIRWRRVLAIAGIAFALAPGTFIKARQPAVIEDAPLMITPLAYDGARTSAGWSVTGLWALESGNSRFGGFSALEVRQDGAGARRFLALSDTGDYMNFVLEKGEQPMRLLSVAGGNGPKVAADVESAAYDPVTGRVWLAYEFRNMIERRDPKTFAPDGSVEPEVMADWGANSGPESMARLADGRFIVISEGRRGTPDGTHRAILFDGDPVEGAAETPFRFRPPDGYRPVGMTALPGGKVAILLRAVRIGLPPHFESAVAIADPSAIRKDETWEGAVAVSLAPPFPSDNFEGITSTTGPGGSVTLWLISDDNFATLQRTLFARIDYTPRNRRAR
ncbi:esterase-like activity of phytase family protein [Qipengyuania sp. JC766]|uniref:esterase-like activity of phytase family protein n=1 Tax=Qipengyuania sp. JC766 TaxID=3232139 RepID=UPI00345AA312